MTQYHTNGHENSGNCARLPPSPGGDGRGEGERFLQSHFRSKRLITQNPKWEIRNPKSIRASLRRLLRFKGSERDPMQNSLSALGRLPGWCFGFCEAISLTVLAFFAVLVFAGCRTREPAPSRTAQPARRPNFVFILTDDQRFDSMGCAGNRLIQTPNLDRLATDGVRLRNHFVTTSICCVS